MNFENIHFRPRSNAAALRMVQRELALLGLPLVVGTNSEGQQCFGGAGKFRRGALAVAARHAEGYRLSLSGSLSTELRHTLFSLTGKGGIDNGSTIEWDVNDPTVLAGIGRQLRKHFDGAKKLTVEALPSYRLTDALGDTRRKGILHTGMKLDFDYKLARSFGSNFCKFCGEDMVEKVVEEPDVKRKVCTSCGNIEWDPPQVVVVTILRDKEHKGLWMIRRSNTQVGKIAFPGGFLMRGEGIFQGGVREDDEETGFKVVIDGFFSESPVPGKNEILVFVLATVVSGKPRKQNKETSAVLHFTYEEAAALQLAYPLHDQAKAAYLAAVRS
jgi:ADP-ribose pyrophosphatase YjhB (NUDIX family)